MENYELTRIKFYSIINLTKENLIQFVFESEGKKYE